MITLKYVDEVFTLKYVDRVKVNLNNKVRCRSTKLKLVLKNVNEEPEAPPPAQQVSLLQRRQGFQNMQVLLPVPAFLTENPSRSYFLEDFW